MATKTDFYEILGVTRDADDKVLKSAFRKLAMQYHPDRNPGDHTAEIKFKEVSAAYECLKDPQKRAAYDRFGHAAFENGGGPAGSPAISPRRCRTSSTISSATSWAAAAAAAPAGRGASAAPIFATIMEISLEEAYSGAPPKSRCRPRSSARPARAAAPSPVRARRPARPARATAASARRRASSRSSAPAPTCQGRGEVIADPCLACNGAGRQTEERKLKVKIPAGIEDGTRIRLAGEGEAGLRGGVAGDLYIFLSIRPHEFFQRDGADIFCRVPVSVTTAALGGEFQVPTIDGGKTKVKVPDGTQTGKQFRLKGKGMPVLRSTQGRRHVYPGRGRDAAQADAPPARAARGIREGVVAGHQSGVGRLLRAGPELSRRAWRLT